MGTYEEVWQRGTPDSTASPVFQETLSRKKSSFPWYLLSDEERFWKSIVKLLDSCKAFQWPFPKVSGDFFGIKFGGTAFLIHSSKISVLIVSVFSLNMKTELKSGFLPVLSLFEKA